MRNDAVVTLDPYRALLARFVAGELPEERFQWGYLDRLAKEAIWRDDETFALLNSLFENERGRDVQSARLVAVEVQGQLAGRLEPLKTRAARMLGREDELGTLRPGAVADVTVLDDLRGRFSLRDNGGTEVIAERLLMSAFCLRAGRRVEADAPILPQAVAA